MVGISTKYSLLMRFEEEWRGRGKLRDVSHEQLRKIQSIAKAELEHCLERYQIR